MVQPRMGGERAFRAVLDVSRERALDEGRTILGELEASRPPSTMAEGTFADALVSLCSFSRRCGPLFEALMWRDPIAAWDLLDRSTSYVALACSVSWPKRIGGPDVLFRALLDSTARARPNRVRGLLEHFRARLDSGANLGWRKATDLHFAAWLGNQYLGDEVVANERLDLGAYASVAAHWNDPDFESALVEALEYHLGSMGAGANDGDTYTGTFALVPIEFEAMRVVRERAGLPMPTLDHPFFKTPFAEYGRSPGAFDPRSDPRFCAIVERAKRDGIVPEGVDLFAV